MGGARVAGGPYLAGQEDSFAERTAQWPITIVLPFAFWICRDGQWLYRLPITERQVERVSD